MSAGIGDRVSCVFYDIPLLTVDGDLPAADRGVVGVGVIAVLDSGDGGNKVALAGGGATGTEAGAVVGEVTSEGNGGGGDEADSSDNLGKGEHFDCPFVSFCDEFEALRSCGINVLV